MYWRIYRACYFLHDKYQSQQYMSHLKSRSKHWRLISSVLQHAGHHHTRFTANLSAEAS